MGRCCRRAIASVAGVREVLVPGEKVEHAPSVSFYGMPATADDEMPRKRLEAARFHEIPVRVELQVRFEVASPGAERRDGGQ